MIGRPALAARAGRAAWLCLLAALAAACDPQAEPDYRGEALVVLRGRVATNPNQVPLEAALLWQRGTPPSDDDAELATRAPVTVGFPSSFTLRLYQPPPGAALRTLAPGEVAFARANAAAVPSGLPSASLANGLPQTAGGDAQGGFGMDRNHWIVHLPVPVPEGSLTAWWLGGALDRGYALLRVTPSCLSPAALAACVAELQARGVREDGSGAPGTATAFCRATYRLAPAPLHEEIVLELGAGQDAAAGTCP